MLEVEDVVELVPEEKQEIVELSELDLNWIGGGGAIGDAYC